MRSTVKVDRMATLIGARAGSGVAWIAAACWTNSARVRGPGVLRAGIADEDTGMKGEKSLAC